LKVLRIFFFATDVDPSQRDRRKRIRAALLFISSYGYVLPSLAWHRVLLETIVEIEEGFVLFRSHHARMVERIIGRRIGTGGSSGVAYLDSTTQYRVFTELWTVRANLVATQALPSLQNPSFYDTGAPV